MISKQRTIFQWKAQPLRKATKLMHKQNSKLLTVNQARQKQLLVIQQFLIYWIYQRTNQPKRIAYWTFLAIQEIVVEQIMHPHNHHRIY